MIYLTVLTHLAHLLLLHYHPLTPPQLATNSNTKALNLAHFFIEIKATKDSEKVQKACKLCIKKYGNDKQKVFRSVPNYFYAKNTGNSNLCHHLINHHHKDYDTAVVKYNWKYKLLTQSDGVSLYKDGHNIYNQAIPLFSPASFLEHLVRFVVVGDQSVCVIETPKFQQLFMVLRETLVEADIPGRNKMREAIINQLQRSFVVF
ncbi:hypothetical protein EDB86DRAFT_3081471 [Lactarius hatsudake]|nr:hypothetical protein EDB86DRAFT_3081471 [Lactarius hatsudake]